ncbi:hypothetical protein CAEBREN_28297 [Caenorhabditis brenneri]|uniref:Uncharacterized protein n=1 Tax=Caenorhabditis brenneri TaxID=135651 RepID=G0M808_CAEBE|nr:hypothetical protein CAEBREN_28297 [Caenorhabditis brenneri]
MSVKENRRGAR